MSNNSSSLLKMRFDASVASENSSVGREPLKKLLSDLSKNGLFYIYAAATAVFCVSFAMIPSAMGDIVDYFVSAVAAAFLSGKSSFSWLRLPPACVKAIIIPLISCVFAVLQSISVSALTSRYADGLRRRCFSKINSVPVAYLDTHSHGELKDTVTDGIDELNQSLNLALTKIITAGLMIPAILIRLAVVNLLSAAVALCFVAAAFAALWLTGRARLRVSADRSRAYGKADKMKNEMCANVRNLRNFGLIPLFLEEINRDAEGQKRELTRTRFLAALPPVICLFFTGLCSVVLLMINTPGQSVAAVGLLISLVFYSMRVFQPMTPASEFSCVFMNLSASARKIFEFLASADEKVSGERTVPSGSVEFDSVSFCYPANSVNVLSGVSFEIPSRGITVLSGRTGAGKSTVIKLLLRLYRPSSGEIRMGGRNVEDFSLPEYRKLFAVVSQDASLIPGTVTDNVAYGAEKTDTEKVKKVCRRIGAGEFIESLPGGYDARVMRDGTDLSAGQIQLLLLARALYNESPYIIFDEATSFADPETEKKITDTLLELSETHGVIIISHRALRGLTPGAEIIINQEN